MTISKHIDGDALIVHAAGTTLRDAHAAAKSVAGIRILDTFVDGWGRVVSRGIVGRAWSEIRA